MSEEKDLYTIVKEKLARKEEPSQAPSIVEKSPEEKPQEKKKYPKLPEAKNPKHFRG